MAPPLAAEEGDVSFITARLRSRSVPPVRELPVAAGAAFELGALLLQDANGAWAECGADPALVGGVSESAYGVDTTGYVRTGRREFPPGMMQATLVGGEQNFHAEYVGALPAADGGTYGVTRGADGKWRVDFGKTGASARVKLVGRLTNSPENRARVIVFVLAANVQVVS